MPTYAKILIIIGIIFIIDIITITCIGVARSTKTEIDTKSDDDAQIKYLEEFRNKKKGKKNHGKPNP